MSKRSRVLETAPGLLDATVGLGPAADAREALANAIRYLLCVEQMDPAHVVLALTDDEAVQSLVVHSVYGGLRRSALLTST